MSGVRGVTFGKDAGFLYGLTRVTAPVMLGTTASGEGGFLMVEVAVGCPAKASASSALANFL